MAPCNPRYSIFTCTLDICCRAQGYVQYEPSLSATLAYLAIFAIFCAAQFSLGVWGKTWGFVIGMTSGLILEVLGYIGRLMVRKDPFSLGMFLFYFLPIGLGPAFLTAAIYLTLGRLVIIYGEHLSRIKPRTYTVGFLAVDSVSIIIQAVGGSICGSARTKDFRQKGVNVMISGLTLQAASLLTFLIFCMEYAIRVRRAGKTEWNQTFAALRERRRFQYFLAAITVAALTIFIRCVYRVIELAEGFSGPIANAEIPFLIFEGPMIMIAVLCLTVFHPSVVFRGGYWNQSEWRLRENKKTDRAFIGDEDEAWKAFKKNFEAKDERFGKAPGKTESDTSGEALENENVQGHGRTEY